MKTQTSRYRQTLCTALLLGGVAAGSAAHAADEAPAAAAADAPSYTLTTNVGLFSQYIFRGISYTEEKPAVQGGADFAHASGFYLGVWGTNISSKAIQNAVGEIDVYGGYATSFGDFGLDVGLLQFLFPSGRYTGTREDYNTLEGYAAVSWKFFKLKYSRSITDYFGFNDTSFGAAGNGDSDGSHYIEANAAVPFGTGWTVDLHVGRQKVKNYEDFNFTDWRVGIAKDLGQGWRAGAAWVDTNAEPALYTIDNVDTGDSKALFYVMRSF